MSSFSFFIISHNDRGYGHLAVSVARNVPFAAAKTAGMHSLSRLIGISQPMNIGVC